MAPNTYNVCIIQSRSYIMFLIVVSGLSYKCSFQFNIPLVFPCYKKKQTEIFVLGIATLYVYLHNGTIKSAHRGKFIDYWITKYNFSRPSFFSFMFRKMHFVRKFTFYRTDIVNCGLIWINWDDVMQMRKMMRVKTKESVFFSLEIQTSIWKKFCK